MLTLVKDACYEDILISLTFFEQKILNIENRLEGTGKEYVVMETKLIIIRGGSHVELLVYQVSML